MRAAALAGLAVTAALLTGCSAVQGALSPAASDGSAGHGSAGHGSAGHGSASHGTASSGTASQGAISGSAARGGAATASPAAASPTAAASRPGSPASTPTSGVAGCAPWPAGSTGTNLDLNANSNGHIYCVATGDTVRVQLSGSVISAWRLLQVSGDALVPVVTPLRPAVMPAFPLRSYRAVRPGDATLHAITSCHPVQPQAAGVPQQAAVVMAHFGGTPISPGCMGVTATFRVLIIVS